MVWLLACLLYAIRRVVRFFRDFAESNVKLVLKSSKVFSFPGCSKYRLLGSEQLEKADYKYPNPLNWCHFARFGWSGVAYLYVVGRCI